MKQNELNKADKFIIIGYGLSITAIFILIIYGFIFCNGWFRKVDKNEILEATAVTIEYKYDDVGNVAYHPTYYYKIDDTFYTYTPLFPTTTSIEDIMIKRLYYNSANPKDVIAAYELTFTPEAWFILVFFAIIITGANFSAAYGRRLIKNFKHLEKNGILVENLECTILPRGFYHGSPLYKAEVEYILPSGQSYLFSENLSSEYVEKNHGSLYADLLFDPENPKIYALYLKI